MLKYIKIFLTSFVVLLIFFGGVTRFHHHLDGTKVCFCTHDHSETTRSHIHDNNACSGHDPIQGSDDSEKSCPLHLDSFIITDTQHLDTPLSCCHQHCDLCSPLAYDDVNRDCNISSETGYIQALSKGNLIVLKHRGPPMA